MTPTYYTPRIEEIHPGFEYEFHGMSVTGISFLDFTESMNPEPKHLSKSNEKVWSREIFSLDIMDSRTIESIDALIKTNQIRVKHLDREDIESLGFMVFSGFYEHGDIQIKYWIPNADYYLFIHQDGRVSLFSGSGDKENFSSFKGIIKNKSELRRLMVQLGITKE